MGALKEVYAGKVKLEVVKANDAEELMQEHMGDSLHGLMAYDSSGKLAGVIPGHRFGKDEIVALIKDKLME